MADRRPGTGRALVPSSARALRRAHRCAAHWAALVPVVAIAAACGSSPPSTTSHPTTSTSPTTSTTAPPSGPVDEVRVGSVKGLGDVLVDGSGFTLYLFAPDKRSGASTCYGRCAQGWPPLLVPTGSKGPIAGPGVEASLLGTTRRRDGTLEVTYNRWPLYLWVGDSVPGQATGQGIDNLGGLWYVLAPDGREITKRAATSLG